MKSAALAVFDTNKFSYILSELNDGQVPKRMYVSVYHRYTFRMYAGFHIYADQANEFNDICLRWESSWEA